MSSRAFHLFFITRLGHARRISRNRRQRNTTMDPAVSYAAGAVVSVALQRAAVYGATFQRKTRVSGAWGRRWDPRQTSSRTGKTPPLPRRRIPLAFAPAFAEDAFLLGLMSARRSHAAPGAREQQVQRQTNGGERQSAKCQHWFLCGDAAHLSQADLPW